MIVRVGSGEGSPGIKFTHVFMIASIGSRQGGTCRKIRYIGFYL